MHTTGLFHAGQKRVDGGAVRSEISLTVRCDGMQLFCAGAGADGYMSEFLEHGERRIDDAWTWAVGAADLILDRLDDLVPVPRLFSDEIQDDQTKITMSEEAAETRAAVSTVVPTAATAVHLAVIVGKCSRGIQTPSGFRYIYIHSPVQGFKVSLLQVCSGRSSPRDGITEPEHLAGKGTDQFVTTGTFAHRGTESTNQRVPSSTLGCCLRWLSWVWYKEGTDAGAS